MNLFWTVVENVTALRRFESMHRFKTLPCSIKSAAGFGKRGVDFPVTRAESFSLREIRHAVHVRTFAAPAARRPARFEKRGGRANRRRCARWRRFPSDCRIELHSDMRIVVLCRNFSRRDIRVLSALKKREIRPSEQRRKQCRRQVEGTANAAA